MADDGLIDWLAEELAPLGTLSHRAMMGGRTLYLDGTVFAILDDGELWLKADAMSDAIWDEAGCPRFTYQMGEGRSGSMNYRRAPAETYDDGEALREWAKLALEAGLRGPVKKKASKA
ncbi:TfoX/Sxy family protein [Sphingobium nicotianae]|uniref:TfoX/Sxy family protein n=1 Tax=Sphingobium nicotianae TaxID=2782607 RepID=A0A9X1ISV9_9SPHN|nr:TfoX/Sxy family protein [Sphingobium nicotianae]MBT2188685.1 TfoX/Sxy family protein [Sphingobium nicotianae]